MNLTLTNRFNATKWLYAFIIIHVLAWTLIPLVVRYTLPLDSMEGYVWGQQLEWGYDKNPFMNGWLTALAVKWGGYSGWMIYLFSQISVAACFWGVWELGKKMLTPTYALISVLLLEGVQYYNFHAIDFNDNTLELGLWSLLILSFYQALRARTTKHSLLAWIGCGVFAGLSMMTKYYTVVLLVPMLVFFLMFRENYKQFRNANFYMGLALFLLIITPHIVWLCSHDFVTVTYAFDRVSSPPTLWNHISYPWQFFYEQLEAFCPAIFLALLLLIGKKPFTTTPRILLSQFDRTFLLIIGLGPFLFTTLLSFIAGLKLRAGWGEPLFSLGGILLMYYLQPRITTTRLYSFLALFFTLFILALTGYSAAFIRGAKPSSANFPGTELAAMMTEQWHQKYHQPLPYVAGSRWLSGNIAFYSPDHPRVYINWNRHMSPWIDESELLRRGAIFIWEKGEVVPGDLTKRFPKLGGVRVVRLEWKRNKGLTPTEVVVGVLGPGGG